MYESRLSFSSLERHSLYILHVKAFVHLYFDRTIELGNKQTDRRKVFAFRQANKVHIKTTGYGTVAHCNAKGFMFNISCASFFFSFFLVSALSSSFRVSLRKAACFFERVSSIIKYEGEMSLGIHVVRETLRYTSVSPHLLALIGCERIRKTRKKAAINSRLEHMTVKDYTTEAAN